MGMRELGPLDDCLPPESPATISSDVLDPSKHGDPAPVQPINDWTQLDCALFMQDQPRRLYVPWHDLAANVNTWRSENRFEQWFFMLKPPGLRLRFRGPNLDQRLLPVLVPWLEQAEGRNTIRSFRWASYEPESFRFGGPAGMAVAHDQFDRDSCLALAYQTLDPADQASLPRDEFSLAVMQDLFRRCLQDSAEVWDVWQRLRSALSGPGGAPIDSQDPEREGRLAAGNRAFRAQSTAGAAALLERAFQDNRDVAIRLQVGQVSRQMTVGPRAWLVAICIFHWNRLGFTAADLAPLVGHMVHLLDPTGDSGDR